MKNKQAQGTLPNPNSGVLYMAYELGQNQWKLGFTTGLGQRPRVRSIQARDIAGLQQEIRLVRQRFQLPTEAPVISCYEAGRDGFWLHRYLHSQGIVNKIVDSASNEVNRRARRTKTDRLDVNKLLTMLMRYQLGEYQVWRIVTVPDPAVEDRRHLHRELASLKKDRTRHINRIKGWLTGQGISKAGNRHIRSLAIEIAWGWLRFQPDSELSDWYQERFGHGSSRMRRIGIVALARRLLIEQWRYLETGTPPAGASLKTL